MLSSSTKSHRLASNNQATFAFSQNWHTMTGVGFGLREPAILGRATVALHKSIDFESLDHALAQFVEEPVPKDLAGRTPAVKLVNRALHWAGAIQRQLQIPVFGRSYIGQLPPREDGSQIMNLAVPYFAPAATAAALTWVANAIRSFLLMERLSTGGQATAQSEFDLTATTIRNHRPEGVNTYRFLEIAYKTNVPVRQFMQGVYCFGTGARSRWFESSITDRTSLLAIKAASDKLRTGRLLRAAGLPAATHALAGSPEEAVQIAKRLGYPVVVKPSDQRQGNGVAANLSNEAAVTSAFEEARQFSSNILVEKHFEGTDYRMIVVDGRLLRVSERRPGGIIGDGVSTVAQLVEIAQQTERHQRKIRERGRNLIDLDAEALELLAAKGLSSTSILPAGHYIRLRRRGNVSAGATARQIALEDVHPDNRRLAERAAKALRLDLAGADVIFPDISQSWLETGAHICEVNAQPQLGRKATGELLAELLGGNGRIPVMLVIGNTGAVDWTRLHHIATGQIALGFACDEGVWLANERLTRKHENAFQAGHVLLNNSETEAAVICIPPSEVRKLGLPVDTCRILLLDDPRSWNEQDRAGLSEVLDIALPHSEAVASVAPVEELGLSNVTTKRFDRAGFGTAHQACKQLLADLL